MLINLVRSSSVEPLVSQNLVNREALSGILCQQACDKVFATFADVRHELARFKVEGFSADTLLAHLSVFIKEGKFGRKEHSHECADAPNVTTEAVRFAFEDLRG